MGCPAKDNRSFINGVFWILRTGAPWRDLPPDYGNWQASHLIEGISDDQFSSNFSNFAELKNLREKISAA